MSAPWELSILDDLGNVVFHRRGDKRALNDASAHDEADYGSIARRLACDHHTEHELSRGIEAVLKGELKHFEADIRQPGDSGKSPSRLWAEVLDPSSGNVLVTLKPRPTDGLTPNRSREILDGQRLKKGSLSDLLTGALNALPEPTVIIEGSRIVYANEAMRRVTGSREVDAWLGTAITELVHSEDHDYLEALLDGARLDQGTTATCRVRLSHTHMPGASIALQAIPVEADGPECFVLMGMDMMRRDTIAARLMQMDRMVSIGTLAGGLGHEINNPLTFVGGNIDLAIQSMTRLKLSLEQQHRGDIACDEPMPWTEIERAFHDIDACLDDARDGTRRVRDIVSHLKGFSTDAQIAPRPESICDAIESALQLVLRDVDDRATVIRDLKPVPLVMARGSLLRQLLMNLLMNAVQAISPGRPEHHKIVVRTFARGERVIVEVQDSGVGIPETIISRIFDPFFTTRPVGEGTGIGLAICQDIVMKMRGDLIVESVVGKGSTFRVILPAHQSTGAASEHTTHEGSRRQWGRILVIDDEPLVGRLIDRSLRERYDVTLECRAKDALARLDRGERFDAILCDVLMLEMSGIDVYRSLQTHHPDLLDHLIFITGGVFTSETASFIEKTGRPRLQKPFDFNALHDVVCEIMLHSQRAS